jgi:hypothetical protein
MHRSFWAKNLDMNTLITFLTLFVTLITPAIVAGWMIGRAGLVDRINRQANRSFFQVMYPVLLWVLLIQYYDVGMGLTLFGKIPFLVLALVISFYRAYRVITTADIALLVTLFANRLRLGVHAAYWINEWQVFYGNYAEDQKASPKQINEAIHTFLLAHGLIRTGKDDQELVDTFIRERIHRLAPPWP